MRFKYIIIVILGFTIQLTACEKEDRVQNCFVDRPTTEEIVNRFATIEATGKPGEFFIVLQTSIDTRLKPCNLSEEFKIDNLQVMVSGQVKQTLQSGPCCTNDFVITKISK